MTAEYYYFKPGGKWKYHGTGNSIPEECAGKAFTHETIKEINGGAFPGIEGDAKHLTVVVVDDYSWPRLVPARQDIKDELHALLKRHRAEICWECGPGSNTHGLYDQKMVVEVDRKTVLEVDGAGICAGDLEE